METKRLLALADYLEQSVPKDRFFMGIWAKDANFKANECNTSACAMGWATTLPLFQKLGLQLAAIEYPAPFAGGSSFKAPVIAYHGRTGFDAAAYLFNITFDQAEYLFSESGDTDVDEDDPDREYSHLDTPQTVAARIRRFVSSNGNIEE